MSQSSQYNLRGLAGNVQIGRRGPRFKETTGGVVQFRDASDTIFARVQGADSVTDDDLVTRRQLLAAGGSLAGMSGITWESIQFFMDPGNRNTYPGSGTSVTDLLGNATGGTLNAGMSYNDGAFEGTNGGNGAITFAKGASLDNIFSGGGTVVMFLRPDTEGQVAAIAADTSEGATNAGWLCFFNTTGRLDFVFRRYFTTTQGEWEIQEVASRLDPTPDASGIDPVPPGAWSMLVISYDDSAATNDPTFWMNNQKYTTANGGVVENDAPSGTAQSDAGNEITLGNRPALDRDYDGLIGPMLWFDRELTDTEVLQIYSAIGPRFGLGSVAPTVSVGEGTRMAIVAGSTTDNSSDGFGGPLYTAAGDSSSTNNTTSGGDRLDRAGDHTGLGKGGNFTSRAGDASGTGNGGAYVCRAGDGDSGGTHLTRGGDATGGNGGDATHRGGHGSGSGSTGGDAFYGGGDGDVAVANTNGGDTFINAGDGGNGGLPGSITSRSGESAGVNATTGNITHTTVANGPATTVQGTGDVTNETGPVNAGSLGSGDVINRTGNATGGAAPSGAIRNETGDSDSTNSGGAVGDIVNEPGDATGNSASAQAGSFIARGGNATGATAGNPGRVDLNPGTGPGESGAVRLWSHGTGFTRARSEERTFARVVTIPASGTVDVVTLGTLAADGDVEQYEVFMSGRDATTNNAVISFAQTRSAYRNTGTVTMLAGHASGPSLTSGIGSATTKTTALAIAGTSVVLRISNSAAAAATYRVSGRWTRQGSGQAS